MKKIIINSLIGAVLATSFTGCLATKDLGLGSLSLSKTVKCEGERPGKEISVNGTSYLVVDDFSIKHNLDRAETLCTSNVTTMAYLFQMNEDFNKDISSWDTSNVKIMKYMFAGASSFNQDISGWDVSNVLAMQGMFHNAKSFNQNLKPFLGGWDVSKVLYMDSMFKGADSFNQNISGFNCVNVELPVNGFNTITSPIPDDFVNENYKKSYLPNCERLKQIRERNRIEYGPKYQIDSAGYYKRVR